MRENVTVGGNLFIFEFLKTKIKKIIILFFLISKIAFAQSSFENDSILIWNENRKITWTDFKSQNKVHSYEHASAVITPGLIAYPKTIEESKIKKVKIIATVYKNKSWYKIKEDYILNHEQVHFNITEIYARKFRKELAKIEESGDKINANTFLSLFHKIEDEHWEFQFQYEDETQRGTNFNQQKIWNEKIQKLLNELDDFKLDVKIEELLEN
ncbi:MAG: hypothetical protein E6Q46_03595 [Flavobacterium sp.]|nr:MAG: hypothetical protein E6Q46_03595 [Flavobacterium sp.]